MIDNRSEMAVYFLARLAVLKAGEVLRLSALSNETGFSMSYLEALAKQLRAAEFINSVRGPKGGYTIAKYSGDIYLGAVFKAVSIHDKNRIADEETSIILGDLTQNMISKLTLFSVLCRLPEGWKRC